MVEGGTATTPRPAPASGPMVGLEFEKLPSGRRNKHERVWIYAQHVAAVDTMVNSTTMQPVTDAALVVLSGGGEVAVVGSPVDVKDRIDTALG